MEEFETVSIARVYSGDLSSRDIVVPDSMELRSRTNNGFLEITCQIDLKVLETPMMSKDLVSDEQAGIVHRLSEDVCEMILLNRKDWPMDLLKLSKSKEGDTERGSRNIKTGKTYWYKCNR
ncbi:hypothetical protein V6N13_082229 [Hibiscus sabdariffa]|uniref:Uncharacterized protein n=2 Tax=Hibiscus sabdariffa TaxID=183260 RepID=A0ABR2AL84_9ROSI